MYLATLIYLKSARLLPLIGYLRTTGKWKQLFRNVAIVYTLLLSTISMAACPIGDIQFSTQAQIDNFPIMYPNCTTISGFVYISGPDIIDLTPLAGITTITGSLTISENDSLSSLAGLSGLTTIQDYLFIGIDNHLLTDIGLSNLQTIGGYLNIEFNSVLTTLTGLNNLTSVQSFWIFDNPQLVDLGNLPALTTIQNSIELVNNPVLTTITGLGTVTSLGDYVNIDSNPALLSLQGLHNIAAFNGQFIASNNASLTTCAITSVCRHLSNGGAISVGGNSVGCGSQIEVETICNGIVNTNLNIAGQIKDCEGNPLSSVTTHLTGDSINMTQTDGNGVYQFDGLLGDNNYTITPEEDDNHSAGVDIGDMIRIARHIANIEKFASPFQLIAADVNRNGRVDSRDRSEIFQLVLGRESRFDNNTSWRFIPSTYTFPAAALPPTGEPGLSYPESVSVTNLTANTQANFTGVKIGDVSSCNEPQIITPFLKLFMDTLEFTEAEAPTTISMPIKVDQFNNINGLQFGASWDPTMLRYVGHTMTNLGGLSGDIYVDNGRLNAVILEETGGNQSLPSNSTLMELKFAIKVADIEEGDLEIKIDDNDFGEDDALEINQNISPKVISTINNTTNTDDGSTSRNHQRFNNTSLAESTPIVQSGRIIIRSTTIPTLSQWGLLIFGLLVLNLGVISIFKKEQGALIH